MIRKNVYCWHCKKPNGYTGTGLCKECRRSLAGIISFVGLDYMIHPNPTNLPNDFHAINELTKGYVGKRFADDVGFYSQGSSRHAQR